MVVLPTYNEAANIERILELVRTHAPDANILVVDDGSPDGTADMADKVGEQLGKIEVLRRAGKSGLGSAYRAGFRHGMDAGFDMLIEMDSDLQHDPADLPKLIEKVEGGADLAIGSRYVPGGHIPEWAWHRRLLSKGGNQYASIVLGIGVRDATSGFRAYRATMLRTLDLDAIKADGYGFQIEMAYEVRRHRGDIREVPISFSERQLGESKMSSRIVVEALILVTWWGIRDRIFRRPKHSARPV